jgi:hypothetical protein
VGCASRVGGSADRAGDLVVEASSLSRLHKLAIDTGEADDHEQAAAIFDSYVLEIALGAEVAASEALQAAALTAVNCGARAFPGGVRVRLEEDGPCLASWGRGGNLSAALTRFCAELVSGLQAGPPVLVIGGAGNVPHSDVVLHVHSDRWAGGVSPKSRADHAHAQTLSSVFAAAVGVSECFQHLRRDLRAGHRDAGLSLWEPRCPWTDPLGRGPELELLPAEAWLIGLGHLGQGYGWLLGLLPYSAPAAVSLVLQDFDSIELPNLDTSMLASPADLTRLKTRVVAERLEALGFRPRLVERRLRRDLRVAGDEPMLALAGLDRPEVRAHLDSHDFPLIVDAGLGAGPNDYLNIHVQRLPGSRSASDIWPGHLAGARDRRAEQVAARVPAYEKLAKDRCGALMLAGQSVATAFVGTAAACLVLAEPLRALHDGACLEITSYSLRNPTTATAVELELSADRLPRYQQVR